MFRSMTAFGRAVVLSPLCEIVVELISLNRKHLEIRFQLPQELVRFEPYLRSLFDKKMERGMVSVKVQVKWKDQLPLELYPNAPLIKKYIQMRQAVEVELNMKSAPSNLIDWVFEQEGTVMTFQDEEKEAEVKEVLRQAFEKAFIPFFQWKEKEGALIFEEISSRFQTLWDRLKAIQQLAPAAVVRYREKIGKILNEFEIQKEDKDKLIKEVALYADRIDVNEEVIRFSAHLHHLEELAASKQLFIGKTVDFILQELMREINTMGNKAQDHLVSAQVVGIKAELEKIREQIQNVE